MNQKITFLAGLCELLLVAPCASFAQQKEEKKPWVTIGYDQGRFGRRYVGGVAGMTIGTFGSMLLLPQVVDRMRISNKSGVVRAAMLPVVLVGYFGGMSSGLWLASIESVSVRFPKLSPSSEQKSQK